MPDSDRHFAAELPDAEVSARVAGGRLSWDTDTALAVLGLAAIGTLIGLRFGFPSRT